jgi:AbrB family looped-hinge helix DNA binding protein
MIQISTVTQKGQVTIPYFIRQKLDLVSGTKIAFNLENEKIILSPIPSFFDFRGSIKSKKEFDIKKMRQSAKNQLKKRYGKSA